MRKLVLALFLTIIGATGLEAQQFLAFTKRPVTKEEYAAAIQNNDRRILNLDCTSLVQSHNAAMGRMGSQHRVNSCAELATYIGSLVVVECPQGVTTGLGRVSRTGRVDLTDWRRPFRAGEMCLYDNNEGLYVASLSCGNFNTERLSIRPAMPVAARPSEPFGPRRETVVDTTRIRVDVNLNDQRQPILVQERRRGSWFGRNWPWLTLATAAVGGGVYCGVVSDTHCGMRQEVVIIHN